MKGIPGDSLTRFTNVMQLAGENPDDEDYGMLSDDIDSEEDAADASTEDATTEAIGMLRQYGDSVRSGDGSTEGPVWPAANAAAELHPGEIARRAALESLAVSAALRLFRRFFPDDDDTLGRRVVASAVAACGGQVGFRRMLEDGDAVAFALIDEHRHAAASSAAESSGPGTSGTAKQDDSARGSAQHPKPPTIVLSGAPCAGKSAIAAQLPDVLREHGVNVVVVPEVATAFMESLGVNFNPASLSHSAAAEFQAQLFDAQLDAASKYATLLRRRPIHTQTSNERTARNRQDGTGEEARTNNIVA